jgi:hypothetical protein
MRALVIAGIVFVSACSLGALDGFSGGAADGPDAASDATALVDSSTSDTSSGADGSGDSGAKSFCGSLAQPARACVDFDDGTMPLGFTQDMDNGGSVDFVAGGGKDGTGGFVAASSPSAGNSASACIAVILSGPRKSIVVEADFRVDDFGTDNLELLNFDSGGVGELGVSMTGTKLLIEEDYYVDGGEQFRQTATSAVAKNTWQRVRFSVTTAAAIASVEMFVDGISVGTHKADGAIVTGTTRFEIGDCELVGAQGWTVHYDNVVVYETN